MSQDGAQKHPNPSSRLTHFLCLPLINEFSLPQLVSSIEQFRAYIPLVENPAASTLSPDGTADAVLGLDRLIPLVPDAAIRPLGTLHLTLGVMSLPTKDRLDEALNFLESLDLIAIMREAQEPRIGAAVATTERPTSPLTVDLKSLHAIPNTRAATVLHAEPVDRTSRLYPFCVLLRNKFIEAGFMKQDMIKDSPKDKGDDNRGSSNMRPRPLLLHATIANTVYLGRNWNQAGGGCGGGGRGSKGGRGGRGGGRGGRGGREGRRSREQGAVYKFDATCLLKRFGDGFIPHQSALSHKAIPRHQPFKAEVAEPPSQGPFVWAQSVPLDRLCICEMGAKPVPHDKQKGGPELGEEYKIIGQKSLRF